MIGDPGKNVGEPGLRIDPVEFGGFDERARAHSDPMESDRRSNFLFGRIFFDEPVSTSSENALAVSFQQVVRLVAAPGHRHRAD